MFLGMLIVFQGRQLLPTKFCNLIRTDFIEEKEF